MITWIMRAARDLYASLGLWCIIGLLPSLSAFLVLYLGWWLLMSPAWERLVVWCGTVVLLSPLFMGVAAQAFRAVRGEPLNQAEWIMDTYRLAWHSMKLAAVWLTTVAVLITNSWLYWRFGSPISQLLCLLSGSLLIMWLWSTLYLPSLLSEHVFGIYANRKQQGTLWILYRSFLLVLSNPAIALGSTGIILLWTLLNILIPIGLLTVWLPGILLFTAHLEKDLMRRVHS